MPEELVMHLQSEYTHAWAVLGCAGLTEHIPGWAVPHTSLAHGKSSAGCCSPWQLPLKHSSCTTCVALPVSNSAARSPCETSLRAVFLEGNYIMNDQKGELPSLAWICSETWEKSVQGLSDAAQMWVPSIWRDVRFTR